MQSKSEQISTLIELNDELENYFRNTIIPQLFVDASNEAVFVSHSGYGTDDYAECIVQDFR